MSVESNKQFSNPISSHTLFIKSLIDIASSMLLGLFQAMSSLFGYSHCPLATRTLPNVKTRPLLRVWKCTLTWWKWYALWKLYTTTLIEMLDISLRHIEIFKWADVFFDQLAVPLCELHFLISLYKIKDLSIFLFYMVDTARIGRSILPFTCVNSRQSGLKDACITRKYPTPKSNKLGHTRMQQLHYNVQFHILIKLFIRLFVHQSEK